MRTLRLFLFGFFALTIISNAQTIIPPGDVSGTWAIGGSPYEVQGEITIPDGLTLTIEPGVLVEFQGHYKLIVDGRLLAIGTETDTITFTINDTTGFSNPDTSAGGWHGIRFDSTSAVNDSSKIIHCKLQYGKAIGDFLDNSGGAIYVADFDKLIISKCLIANNSADGGAGGGIFLAWSSPRIEETTISNNTALWAGGIDCFFDSSPIIRDNTIIGNYASNYGGGIECNHTSFVIIENNIITENDAHEAAGIKLEDCSFIAITDNVITNNNAIDDDGGGLYARDCENITIEGNTISNNTAVEGGGIWLDNSETTIDNNSISDNTAETDGGGIFCKRSTGLTFTANIITGNQANNSGGGINIQLTNLQIDGCSFTVNDAYSTGGAISFGADTSYTGLPYQVTITNTSFLENTAYSRAGVYINNWGLTPLIIDVMIDKCEFLNNVSDNYTGLCVYNSSISISKSVFSGNNAIRYTAAAGFSSGCIGTISNCLFASNIANTGGGNWNSGGLTVWGGSNIDIMNCTFADNSAYYGAGLTVGYGGTATVTNCIFWGNSTDQISLGTYNNIGGTLFVNHCDVEGGEASVNIVDPLLSTLNWGIGNIDEDPDFENPGNSGYNIQDSSPCIGTGIDSMMINSTMCYCPTIDIEGNLRPDPEGSMPDMGAYESPLANPVGVEENGVVHPTDYALYQNYPNPFNPTTKIKYQIPELSFVTIKVYDVLGGEVATLVNEEKPVGNYDAEFYASTLPSGVYFYRLQVGSFVETKKMVLLR